MTVRSYWLVKTEPSEYAWEDLVREGRTLWEGVRNHQARNNLQAMRRGDRVLVYHSMRERAAVGTARVSAGARPDPTSDDPRWVAVELKPLRPLPRPVTLAEMKHEPALAGMALLRQSRLSVAPLRPEEFEKILEMAGIPSS